MGVFMPIIRLGNRDLYVEQYGNVHNFPIVYFHGGPGANCLDFREQAKRLSDYYYVIIFDQFGCLRSGRPDKEEQFGMVEQISLSEDLRKHLTIDFWGVIGHSYGGMLACLYADTYPDSAAGVVYECPSFNMLDTQKSIASYFIPYFKEIEDRKGVNLCETIINKNYSQCVEDVFSDIMNVVLRVSDEKKRQYIHGVSFEQYNNYRKTENLDENLWDSEEHVRKILAEKRICDDYLPLIKNSKHLSLLICGKYDPKNKKKQMDYFKSHIKNGDVAVFEDSGHFPRQE
jgi:proline iminopeptidase